MRIDEPIETSGFFWLPEEPDFRVPGDLHISESGQARLEVKFQEPSPGWRNVINTGMSADGCGIARIIGTARGHGAVTLDECVVTNLQGFGIPATELTLIAEFAFTGCRYEAEEDVPFTEFTFSAEGVDQWLAVSGINVQFDWETWKAAVDIRAPEDISLNLPCGAILKFKFGMDFPPIAKTVTEVHATQRAFVSILSDQPMPVEYFTPLATKLRNFLRLATGQPVSINSATGYSRELTRSDGPDVEYMVPIKVYYGDAGSSNKKQDVPWFQMLFTYPDVKGQVEEILANWLHSYEVFGPALDVYFTAMSNTSQYLEVEFLQRVQGIETLHRRSFPETEMPEDEFAGMMDSLLLACPSERREWLKSRLRYANEFSLRRRLRRMIEPFRRFFGDHRQQKAFIDKVVVTRNYWTHYDSSLEGEAAKGRDMRELTKVLEALFQLHLLRLIGFDSGRIEQTLQGGSNLRKLLASSGLNVPEDSGPGVNPQYRGATLA